MKYPKVANPTPAEAEDLPESLTELLWSVERKLDEDPEKALELIQRVLEEDPKNPDAQKLLPQVEEKLVKAPARVWPRTHPWYLNFTRFPLLL